MSRAKRGLAASACLFLSAVTWAASAADQEKIKSHEVHCHALGPGALVQAEYFDSGALEKIYCLRDEKFEGRMAGYFENGRLSKEGEFKDGKLQGRWIRYYSDGKKKDEGNWDEGVPNGHWQFWDSSGQLREEGEMQDGIKSCTWKTWDPGTSEMKVSLADCRAGGPRWGLRRLEAGFVYLVQSSGGQNGTVEALWHPSYRLGGKWEARARVGLSTLKQQDSGKLFPVTFLQLGASTEIGANLAAEVALGPQNWWSSVPDTGLLATLGLSLDFRKAGLSRLRVAYSRFFFPEGDPTHQFHFGAEILF